MNPMILGQKIKEARLAKKMTQSEVVGSFITRNMLSQIESGTAMPSMRTLTYLTQVLDLSLSALLSEANASDELSGAAPTFSQTSDSLLEALTPTASAQLSAIHELLRMRTLFAEQQYTTLLEASAPLSEEDMFFDEKAAYRARAAYAAARLAEQNAELSEALSYAKEAEKWADVGFYANTALKADALLLLSRLAGELSRQYYT